MSIKSILRAVGGLFAFQAPMSTPPTQMAVTDRLTSRRDWLQANPVGCAACNWTGLSKEQVNTVCHVCNGRGLPFSMILPNQPLPIDPAPAVAPWDARTPVWPPHDDPYAKPEPCDVVQDPGLSTIRGYAERTNENSRRLAERGLSGRPMDSVKSVTDLLQLIERQEAAEAELIHRGMIWSQENKRWMDPETELA